MFKHTLAALEHIGQQHRLADPHFASHYFEQYGVNYDYDDADLSAIRGTARKSQELPE